MFRQRAMEAVDMIQYLQDFSRTADFSDLAPLFREAEDLDRAAVRSFCRCATAAFRGLVIK